MMTKTDTLPVTLLQFLMLCWLWYL